MGLGEERGANSEENSVSIFSPLRMKSYELKDEWSRHGNHRSHRNPEIVCTVPDLCRRTTRTLLRGFQRYLSARSTFRPLVVGRRARSFIASARARFRYASQPQSAIGDGTFQRDLTPNRLLDVTGNSLVLMHLRSGRLSCQSCAPEQTTRLVRHGASHPRERAHPSNDRQPPVLATNAHRQSGRSPR